MSKYVLNIAFFCLRERERIRKSTDGGVKGNTLCEIIEYFIFGEQTDISTHNHVRSINNMWHWHSIGGNKRHVGDAYFFDAVGETKKTYKHGVYNINMCHGPFIVYLN